MSFQITKTNLTLTKGDTFSIPVDFHQPIDGAQIGIQVYQKGKIIPIIDKVITEHIDPKNGKSLLVIEKELTNLATGTYQIQMFITFLDGTRYTFYPASPNTQAVLNIIPAIQF